MSRAAKILIALIMMFTASVSHGMADVVVSNTGGAELELTLDSAGDDAAGAITHRCASPTGSPANARVPCPFETATQTGSLSLAGPPGRQEIACHPIAVRFGRSDNPDHGPPKPLS